MASFGAEDIDQLVDDKGVIRNRRKILATLENASTMLDLIAVHGAFHGYMRSLDSLDYYGRVAALTTRFAWLGRTSAFVFRHSINEETSG